MVEVLISCVASLNLWIALLTIPMLSLGILVHQGLLRIWKISPHADAKIFPSRDDLPWLLMLAASGIFYVLTCFVEPPFTDNMRVTAERAGYPAPYEIGAMTWVLSTAALFLVSIRELTRRWERAGQLRLFYVYALMFAELIFLAGAPLLPRLLQLTEIDTSHPLPHSVVPEWLSFVVRLAALAMIFRQFQLTWKKSREKRSQISLCKFSGNDLVRVGLLLGLFFAGAGELFMLIAMALAYQSTMLISCLIAWGTSIKEPIAHPFHPEIYGPHEHLSFLTYTGLIYVWFCVTGGLLTVIVLSGLEFVRFNGFRLYKVRKIRRATVARIPVLNE